MCPNALYWKPKQLVILFPSGPTVTKSITAKNSFLITERAYWIHEHPVGLARVP